MSDGNIKTVPIFGGAMSCELPSSMVDVSDFRQVPDNQEVYNDADTGATVIVELLARHTDVSDSEAAAFFYMDLAKANGCDRLENGVTLTATAPLPPTAYPHVAPSASTTPQAAATGQVCAYAALAYGVQKIAKYTNEGGKENDVFVGLVVLRFRPRVSTDMLVSLSAPQRVHPESSDAKSITRMLSEEERMAVLHRAVASLKVNDWGLFVPED